MGRLLCEHTASGATTEGESCTLGANGGPDAATKRHVDNTSGHTMGVFCDTHSTSDLVAGQTAEVLDI